MLEQMNQMTVSQHVNGSGRKSVIQPAFVIRSKLLNEYRDDVHDAADRDVEEEEHEILVVVPPHAITHPRTVVIHPEHTPIF